MGAVTVGLREDSRNPGHVRVSVFVGRNEGARGHAGVLTLRTAEWDDLRADLEHSAGPPPYLFEVLPPLGTVV